MLGWAFTINNRLNRRIRRKAHTVACEATEALENSLRVAGRPELVPCTVRRAFWVSSYGYRKYCWNLLAWLLALAALVAAGRLARLVLPPAAVPYVRPAFGLLLFVGLFMFLLYVAVSSSNVGWLGLGGKFSQVKTITDVVNLCGAVVAAGPRTRPDHLGQVARDLRYVEQAVLKLYRRRGTVPTRSHRTPELKRHARLVAARLRVAEAGLDTDAETAAKELARLLMDVAENYSIGQVGALLAATELKDIEPITGPLYRVALSMRGLARALAMAALVGAFAVGGMWAASRFGVPPAIAAIPAIALAGVLAPALVSVVTPQQK
ncbi:hypothetical protein AB0O31_31685 [Kitasatospora cineracea]|uniref:hypothetical protein n=1 Tax=Kitasatospora cineracea TaxID=88074 RepID=UPI0034473A82